MSYLTTNQPITVSFPGRLPLTTYMALNHVCGQ